MRKLYAIQMENGKFYSWGGIIPSLWTDKKSANTHRNDYPDSLKGAKVVQIEFKVIK